MTVLPKGYLSPHFRSDEFRCRCCGKLHPSGIQPPAELLDILEDIRSHFGGKAVTVVSGYRCPIHNKAVGGAKYSQHMVGNAADIQIAGVSPDDVTAYADKVVDKRGGVGRYGTFTHVDTRGYKARWQG